MAEVIADQGHDQRSAVRRDLDWREVAESWGIGVEGERGVDPRLPTMRSVVDVLDGAQHVGDRGGRGSTAERRQGDLDGITETEQDLTGGSVEGPATDRCRAPGLGEWTLKAQGAGNPGHQRWLRRVAVTS